MSQAGEESEVPASIAAEEEDPDHEDEEDEEPDDGDDDDEQEEKADEKDRATGAKDSKATVPVKKTKKDSAASGGDAQKKKSNSASNRAGLTFPVARIRKSLKEGGYAKRIPVGGAIYLTAVIEYIVAEILELAGNSAKEQKKNRIIPRHVQLAIRNDEELNKYMSHVTIQGGGVIPNIHTVLMPNKNQPKGGAGASGSFSQEY